MTPFLGVQLSLSIERRDEDIAMKWVALGELFGPPEFKVNRIQRHVSLNEFGIDAMFNEEQV